VLHAPNHSASSSRPSGALTPASIGTELLTYRLALATTGEYARFQDPQASPTHKVGVLAELVSLTNRVTGVYERELGIRLQLIEREDAIIYTDPNTDSYANSNGNAMVGQNIRNLSAVLGDDAFDVGHVVSTGGGGLANLGVVCNDSRKAGGVTGLTMPVGDGFYIDYVAHELGHQFGADHTFNSDVGSCGGGNRAARKAYEPGSGTTIMAYAGICGADNIQSHSDAMFHSASFDQIVAYTRQGTGASCATNTASGNRPPSAKVPAGGFTLPAATPFELTGRGSDPDGNALSFEWEERDLGAAGSPDAATGTAPLFRSFPPTTSPTRSFPRLADILGQAHTLGEWLPTESRPLNFRFTVRDNQAAPSAGGVASAILRFNVTADAGPFKVTAPNINLQAASGGTLKVRWAVAKTDVAPVSCASVDIGLSTDGGQTMGYKLKTQAANTGSVRLTLPVVKTSQARIKVKCHDNVFVDISDADFRIGSP
jgi:Metallo-peptidase family M12B Reprolysin-like